jgi:hypothetical protein
VSYISKGRIVGFVFLNQLILLFKIRKATASRLYETILNYADLIPLEENYDEAVLLMTETDWDQHLDIIRPIRNRICDLTNTPKPVMKAKKVCF